MLSKLKKLFKRKKIKKLNKYYINTINDKKLLKNKNIKKIVTIKKIKLLDKYINDYVIKIPKKYNQCKLLNYFTNDNIDHYISISNRADGKTYNYIKFFIKLAIDFDIKFILLSRNFTVRNSYCEIVNNITQSSKDLEYSLLEFNTTQFYRSVVYNKKTLGIITDLNEATNLKYFSQYIKNFDILIYDEFLAIENDYLPDEWERLKTIYSSVNRDFSKDRIIKYPKIFYLGNAVNFSSPILANLKLYNILENHTINTAKRYGNICLEINKNENVNTIRNLRAFSEDKDGLTNADFKSNQFNIANEKDFIEVKKDYEYIIVKIDNNNYLRIEYNKITLQCVLSITINENDYNFNTEIKDNKDNSIYLSKKYYKEKFTKKYVNNLFLFKNEYSKNYILSDYRLSTLNIYKLLNCIYHDNENIYKVNETEILLNNLYNKIFK